MFISTSVSDADSVSIIWSCYDSKPMLFRIYSSNILMLMKGHESGELVGTVNQFLCLALILL